MHRNASLSPMKRVPWYTIPMVPMHLAPMAPMHLVKQIRALVGPTAAFYRGVPTGMHGPTCIFWATLTPFSLQASVR